VSTETNCALFRPKQSAAYMVHTFRVARQKDMTHQTGDAGTLDVK
jgi:hypothetical protein